MPPVKASSLRRRRRIRLLILIIVLGGLFSLKHLWWPPIFHNLAADRLRRGHVEEGLAWLDYVDWLVPNDVATTLLRARAYRKLGEMPRVSELLSEARREGASAEQIDRERILASAQSGQMREAEPHLGALLSANVDLDDVCEAFVVGYSRNLRYSEAFGILELWVQDSPDLSTPFFLRGKLQASRYHAAEAEADFRHAIALDPNLDEFRLELALVIISGGRYQEAVPLLESCLDTPKLRADAVVNLSICLNMIGEADRAQTLLEAAHREFPDDSRVLLELGRSQYTNGSYEAAAKTLTNAVAIDPRLDQIHYLLAQALSQCGRHDEAAAHFEFVEQATAKKAEINRLSEVVALDARNVDALVSLGQLHLETGNVNEGVTRLLSAIDLDPENQRARRLLFEYYSTEAQHEPAYQAFADEHGRYLD